MEFELAESLVFDSGNESLKSEPYEFVVVASGGEARNYSHSLRARSNAITSGECDFFFL